MGAGDPVAVQGWLVGLAAAVVLLAAGLARQSAALGRLQRHYTKLCQGVAEGNLETLLTAHLARIDGCETAVRQLGERLTASDGQQRRCLQRVALVKYDAFDNVGGAVSFVLAVLDDHGDGVLLNSVYGRDGSSTYAKAVTSGGAATALTAEEQRALREAMR